MSIFHEFDMESSIFPLRKWKVQYKGEMVDRQAGTVHQVYLDLQYNTVLKHFDFDSDMEPWTVARAMAR